MRVLFVGHTYVVGLNQGKLQAIAAAGHVEIGLLVPRGWRSDEWKRRFLLETPYVSVKSYPSEVWFEGRVGAYVYPPWAIRRVVSDFEPDLVQVEQEMFALSTFELALSCRLTRTPLVISCCENVDRWLPLPRRWTRDYCLSSAAMILAGNKGAANLVRSWGYRGPIEQIPQLGVDTRLFFPRGQTYAGDRIVIGFVGRLVHQKGVDLLLTASRRLLDRGLPVRLMLVGTGPDAPRLRQLAEDLRLGDHVTWLDTIPHVRMPDVLAECDALVLPSRSVPGCQEQFGHVLIEAMAMGIPVVGSSSGEIPRVIGRDDLVFPEGNSDSLAIILERLAMDQGWRKHVGRYGLDRVVQLYTHERIAERLISCWRSLIEDDDYSHRGRDIAKHQRAVV